LAQLYTFWTYFKHTTANNDLLAHVGLFWPISIAFFNHVGQNSKFF